MSDYLEPRYDEVNRDVLRTMQTSPRYWLVLGISVTIALGCFIAPGSTR